MATVENGLSVVDQSQSQSRKRQCETEETLAGTAESSVKRVCQDQQQINNDVREGKQVAPIILEIFHLFMCLPPELRLMIWEFALGSRTLGPADNDCVCFCPPARLPRPLKTLPPPVLAMVCFESREVATKKGKMYLLENIPRYRHRREKRRHYWTWFDGARDILELPTSCLPGQHCTPAGMMEILEQARSIVVAMEDIRPSWVNDLFQNERVRKNLKTISIRSHKSHEAYAFLWNPVPMVRVFFGDEGPLVLDLLNRDAVQSIEDLIMRNSPQEAGMFQRWMQYWWDYEFPLSTGPPGLYTQEWAKRIFATAWVEQGRPDTMNHQVRGHGAAEEYPYLYEDALVRRLGLLPSSMDDGMDLDLGPASFDDLDTSNHPVLEFIYDTEPESESESEPEPEPEPESVSDPQMTRPSVRRKLWEEQLRRQTQQVENWMAIH